MSFKAPYKHTGNTRKGKAATSSYRSSKENIIAKSSKHDATTQGGKEKRTHFTSTSRVAPYSLCNRVDETRERPEYLFEEEEVVSPGLDDLPGAEDSNDTDDGSSPVQSQQLLSNRSLAIPVTRISQPSMSSTTTARTSGSHTSLAIPAARNSQLRMSSSARTSGSHENSTTRTLGSRTQSRIVALENKVDMLLNKIEKLTKITGKLAHSVETIEERTFTIECSPYKNELWVKSAEEYCTNLKRDMNNTTLARIVRSVLGTNNKKYIEEAAIQFIKKKVTQWKSDERRKIVGVHPFREFSSLSTKNMAAKIIYSMRAPTRVESTYIKNLAALRYFVRKEGDQKGIHKLFERWVGDGIDQTTWNIIMDEDKEADQEYYISESEEY